MTYYNSPKITDWQRQVIIGTVLGGSSIIKPKTGRNCYLLMRSRNHNWLQCKSQELKGLVPPNPMLTDGKHIRWHSCCFPLFNEFHEMFYENNKKLIKMEVLNGLRNIGFAVWFLDSGCLKDDRVYIHVRSFGEEGTKTVLQYFNEIDLEGEIVRNGILLDVPSSKKFLLVVDGFIPSFM